jgi:hypothetical protein
MYILSPGFVQIYSVNLGISPFFILANQARAMMGTAGFNIAKLNQLWYEAANTANDLDNIITNSHNAFFGKDPKNIHHICTFGELCVTLVLTQRGKLMKKDNYVSSLDLALIMLQEYINFCM